MNVQRLHFLLSWVRKQATTVAFYSCTSHEKQWVALGEFSQFTKVEPCLIILHTVNQLTTYITTKQALLRERLPVPPTVKRLPMQ